MDKTNALLHEARIQADENRSKEVRHFSASVVEAVEELQGQLSDAEESNKAVERALKDVDYRGTYADGVLYLKQQLAAAQEENKELIFSLQASRSINPDLRNELAAQPLNKVKAEKAVSPSDPATPGVDNAAFEHWYETNFKPAMERGPLDKYVARQAWFAAKADAIEKGEG